MSYPPPKLWLVFDFYDYIFLCYLLFLIALFISDIAWGTALKIIKKLKIRSSKEDSVFLIAFISLITFLIFELKFDLIGHFFGLVQYGGIGYEILRWKIVRPIGLIIFFGGPIIGIITAILAFFKTRKLLISFKTWGQVCC